jgi:DnaJ-related protein SCJ1
VHIVSYTNVTLIAPWTRQECFRARYQESIPQAQQKVPPRQKPVRLPWHSRNTWLEANLSSGDDDAHNNFVAVAEAYDALSDEETRRIYDQYGHEGLQQHKQGGGRGGGHHDPFDIFSRFFGGSGHFGHQPGARRGPDKTAQMKIPLRDFYNGAEKEFTIEKQAVCSACEGSGSKDGQVDTCSQCGGHGVRVQKHMLAPGIFQQVQMQCQACNGKGKTIRHACPVCNGQRVVRESEKHTLHVEKGMPKGVHVTFENEADESPDWEAGDLIIEVHESDPVQGDEASQTEEPLSRTDGTFFRRRGKDLFWREVLSLREAWMGEWTRNVTHLDGHVVQLSRKRGEVVQPGLVEVVANEGMPIWHRQLPEGSDENEMLYGALHVEYIVVLPDQMEKGMEKEFWAVWEKWRLKKGVDLGKDSGRPAPKGHDEL